MSDIGSNLLGDSSSPYLLQHKDNPVAWMEWGEAAFEAARSRNLPILLSVGYSTCHWCHVMAHESFEDDAIAAELNKRFVCVKVDREERPDVDAIYMKMLVASRGQGGWPLTAVLNHELKPFFLATYLPPQSRGRMPGVLDVAEQVSEMWNNERERVDTMASSFVDEFNKHQHKQAGSVMSDSGELLVSCVAELEKRYDKNFGGFGPKPKFPVPHVLSFLLRESVYTESSDARRMALVTLRSMAEGGIHDHVGGGYHRYSTDEKWLLPHFEKMLYDQAGIAQAFVEAYQAEGDPYYAHMVRDIIDYVDRELGHRDGAFYSAQDADSEGEEGKFYVWTIAELEQALGVEDGEFIASLFGFRDEGNFHDESTGELTGSNILHLALDEVSSTATLKIRSFDEFQERVRPLLDKLLMFRDGRIHPGLDDKIQTSWNGLMIGALANAASALENDSALSLARRAADFILKNLRDDAGALQHTWRAGVASVPAMLDDYAFLASGLIDLWQADGDLRWLKEAMALAETMVETFADKERGGFYQAEERDDLITRNKDVFDGAEPSGNAVAGMVLAKLGHLFQREEWTAAARSTIDAFAEDLKAAPSGHCASMNLVAFLEREKREIVLVEGKYFDGMLRVIDSGLMPGTLVVRKSNANADELAELMPWTKDMRADEGKTTAYVCSGFACSAPTSDPAAFADLLS